MHASSDDEAYRQFAMAEQVFRRSGGLATGDEIARRLRASCNQPVSVLAHWIVGHAVVSFEWLGERMLPLFQFDPQTMQPRHGVAELVGALAESLDEWDQAMWFARPNERFDGAAPAELIERDSTFALGPFRHLGEPVAVA
jgi:hypothetical protein